MNSADWLENDANDDRQDLGAGEAGRPETPRAEDRRKSVVDRRMGLERRSARAEAYTGLERRRGPGRRRADDRRSAEEGEMTSEQFEFVMAIETYKKVNKKMFPTWTEVLEVIQQLGYRKVLPRELRLENVPEPSLTKVA